MPLKNFVLSFLPVSKNSHNFRYQLISKLPHPLKKPSYLLIGNLAFGLRQWAFPQPFPQEWVLLSLQFTEWIYFNQFTYDVFQIFVKWFFFNFWIILIIRIVLYFYNCSFIFDFLTSVAVSAFFADFIKAGFGGGRIWNEFKCENISLFILLRKSLSLSIAFSERFLYSGKHSLICNF